MMNRRKFLVQTGQMLGVGLLSSWQFRFLQSAMAAPQSAPSFLITIRPSDGNLSAWDSPWWHLPVNPSYCVSGTDYPSSSPTFRYSASTFAAGPDFKKTGSRTLDTKLSYLFGSNYGWNSSDFDNFTVLKGIDFGGTGVHGVNLRPFQCGSRSPYAQDFSILAAVSQKVSSMPLYYTSVATSLLAVKGQESSPNASPIILGAPSTWSSMGNITGAGALSDDLNTHKVSAVRALANLQTTSVNPFRKSMYQSYDSAVAGATSIQKQNYASEPQFIQNWTRYLVTILNAQILLTQDSNARKVFQGGDNPGGGADATRGALQDQLNKVQALPANTPPTNILYYGNVTRYDGSTYAMAWRFAVAEQLLRRGLSRVIDIEMPCSDPHHLNGQAMASLDEDLILRTAVMVGWREFLKDTRHMYLDTAGNVTSSVTSTTVFDRTAGLMFDQFDRTPTLSDALGGSNHYIGASAYLFGGLFNTSRIFGAVGMGTAAPAGPFQAIAGKPLAVDFNSSSPTCGMPLTSGGSSINFAHIFPTVCRAMGLTMPSQQITDFTAINALVKGS